MGARSVLTNVDNGTVALKKQIRRGSEEHTVCCMQLFPRNSNCGAPTAFIIFPNHERVDTEGGIQFLDDRRLHRLTWLAERGSNGSFRVSE